MSNGMAVSTGTTPQSYRANENESPDQSLKTQTSQTAAATGQPKLSDQDLALIKAFGAFNAGGDDIDGLVPIGQPTARMSKEEGAIVIASWTERILTLTLKMVKKAAKDEKDASKKQSNRNIERMKEAWKKGDDMRRKAASGKVFGWITKTAALVGASIFMAVAVGLTPLTGGLATPMVIIAGILLASAACAMADQISQEVGGPTMTLDVCIAGLLELAGVSKSVSQPLAQSLTGNLGAGATAIAMAAGASDKDAMIIGIATTVATMIVMMVLTGGGGTSTAAQGANAASTSAAAAKTATQTAIQLSQATTQMTGAVSTVGQGVVTVDMALTQQEIDELRAAGIDAEALMAGISSSLELFAGYLQDMMKNLGKSNEVVADILSSMGDTMAHIVAAMQPGGRSAPI